MDACIKKFNKQLKIFIRGCITLCPESSDMKVMLVTYKLLKTVNIKSPYKIFSSMTCDCEEPILQRDETYFCTHTVTCPEFSLLKLQEYMQEQWKNHLNDDVKNYIWDNLAILINIARKYRSIKQSLRVSL